MQSFYGRRLSRNVSKSEIYNLWDENFFLHNTNAFKRIMKIKKRFSLFNLEVGFGTGDNSVHQASLKKNECFIACDPYLNGLIKLKKKFIY